MQAQCAAIVLGIFFSVSAMATTEREAIDTLRSDIEKQTEAGAFSGTILIADRDHTLLKEAFGFASRRFDVPNTLGTRFNLGSGNKMFTAIATLQLVEQGKISLTDTLDKYIDESWLPKNTGSKIQIQHLLTHASGLGSYFTDEFFESSRYRFNKIEDFKPLIVTDTLEITPGTGFKYSNNGMLLLGVVIQNVSGQSYDDYIQQHVYSVANMPNSGCFRTDVPHKNVAIGYHATDKSPVGFASNVIYKPIRGGPAGGCYSTVGDMYNFARALLGYKLLSRKFTEALFVPKTEFHDESYGYGFKIYYNESGNRVVGHRGGFYGVSASFEIYLDKGYIVVILTNLSGAAHNLAPKVREALTSMDED